MKLILLILLLTSSTAHAVTIKWSQSDTQNVTGFNIYCSNGGDFVLVGAAGPTETSKNVPECGPNAVYRMTAINGSAESLPSNSAKLSNIPSPSLMCDSPKVDLWLVTPWNGSTDRKVYQSVGFSTTNRVYIGRVAVGIQCGVRVAPYSDRIKVLEWREVTLPGGVIGVTVCKKQ